MLKHKSRVSYRARLGRRCTARGGVNSCYAASLARGTKAVLRMKIECGSVRSTLFVEYRYRSMYEKRTGLEGIVESGVSE